MVYNWVDVNGVLQVASSAARASFGQFKPDVDKAAAERAMFDWLKEWAHELHYPKHVALRKTALERGVHMRARLVVEPVGYGRILQPCAVMTTDLIGPDGEPIWIEAGKSAMVIDIAWFAWKSVAV